MVDYFLEMLPENLLKAPSVVSSGIEELLANLREDTRSRIQSAASLSVVSAHDLARRQTTLSATSGRNFNNKQKRGKI